MVRLLHSFIADKVLGYDKVTLVVRYPPNDFVDLGELEKCNHIVYNVPGVRFSEKRGQDWDMTFQELDNLRDLLHHSSLVICSFSSLSVDAAVFDKPVININFDVHDESMRHPYYETTHYSKVAKVGGIRLVHSKDELLLWMRKYFQDPTIDSENRKKLVQMQAWKLDGQSSKRIVDFMLGQLSQSST